MPNVWERLSIFESRDLVSIYYRNRHGRSLNAKKADSIICHFGQGREYFRSASQSADLVKPLLFYYGVLSLSRGLILYLNPDARESTLKQSHGLKDVRWEQALSRGTRYLLDALVRFEGGTFFELCEATRNREKSIIHGGSFAEPAYWVTEGGGSPVPLGTEWTLKEVLSRIPDLQPIYERTFDSHSKCFPAQVVINYQEAVMDVTVNILSSKLPLPTVDQVRATFGLPSYFPVTEATTPIFGRRLARTECRALIFQFTSKQEMAEKLLPTKINSEGQTFVVAPTETGGSLSSLCLMYITAYALSMLVRYYPSHWIKLLNRTCGDQVYPLLKAGVSVIEQRFPDLIALELEELTAPGVLQLT